MSGCKSLSEHQFSGAVGELTISRPMWLSSDSSSFVNCRALPHESASLSIGPILLHIRIAKSELGQQPFRFSGIGPAHGLVLSRLKTARRFQPTPRKKSGFDSHTSVRGSAASAQAQPEGGSVKSAPALLPLLEGGCLPRTFDFQPEMNTSISVERYTLVFQTGIQGQYPDARPIFARA
jgi:hypothetical protein